MVHMVDKILFSRFVKSRNIGFIHSTTDIYFVYFTLIRTIAVSKTVEIHDAM